MKLDMDQRFGNIETEIEHNSCWQDLRKHKNIIERHNRTLIEDIEANQTSTNFINAKNELYGSLIFITNALRD